LRRVACTIVAKNCVSLARVLARSFSAHHPDIPFVVLLADEIDGCFDPAGEPFELVPFDALAIPRRLRFRFHYAQQPLSYACTPSLLRHLLDRGYEQVLFFKQESLVVGDHGPAFAALDRHPIVLTPHLLAPLEGPDRAARELNILQSGVFNVGLLGVSSHPTARRFLDWWQDRVFAHAHHAVPNGMHYEQRWLDLVPAYFPDAHALRDPGFNVAHWNLPDRVVENNAGSLQVSGRPCRLFRFSGYDPDEPLQPTRYSTRLTWDNLGPARDVFAHYHRLLIEAGYPETSTWPYAYGTFSNDIVVPNFVRQLYLHLGDAVDAFGDPLDATSADSFFAWLTRPVHTTASGAGITNLWHFIYKERVDLVRAFPDIRGADGDRFVAWTRSFGLPEHDIPEVLLGPGALTFG
jgi:hypothetical protein